MRERNRPDTPTGNHSCHEEALIALWQAKDALQRLETDLEDYEETCRAKDCYLCCLAYEASGLLYLLEFPIACLDSIVLPFEERALRTLQEAECGLALARQGGDEARIRCYAQMVAFWRSRVQADDMVIVAGRAS